jgi:hypothetical protein
MSCANASCSSSETIALPPYLTTMIWSRKRCSHGSDSMRTAAFGGLSGVGVLTVAHELYALFSCT